MVRLAIDFVSRYGPRLLRIPELAAFLGIPADEPSRQLLSRADSQGCDDMAAFHRVDKFTFVVLVDEGRDILRTHFVRARQLSNLGLHLQQVSMRSVGPSSR